MRLEDAFFHFVVFWLMCSVAVLPVIYLAARSCGEKIKLSHCPLILYMMALGPFGLIISLLAWLVPR